MIRPVLAGSRAGAAAAVSRVSLTVTLATGGYRYLPEQRLSGHRSADLHAVLTASWLTYTSSSVSHAFLTGPPAGLPGQYRHGDRRPGKPLDFSLLGPVSAGMDDPGTRRSPSGHDSARPAPRPGRPAPSGSRRERRDDPRGRRPARVRESTGPARSGRPGHQYSVRRASNSMKSELYPQDHILLL